MTDQPSRIKPGMPSAAVTAIILAGLCGLALYLRIALPYDRIFVDDWVWLRGVDAYFHLRHIENLLHNFPRFNLFDPYVLYPGGGGGLSRPFFDWLVAGVILLVSKGEPAQHTISSVSACMPAILGTLTLIPVYFIGKELFGRWADILSAALVAVLPSELLHRSLLGYADHHVAETLFSTATTLFLIMAIKRARERQICLRHMLNRDWAVVRTPLLYALLAGISLGCYLLSWIGGLLFILIVLSYLVIQFTIDHLRHTSTDYLFLIAIPLFLMAFLMLLPALGQGSREVSYRVSMAGTIGALIALTFMSRLMVARGWKPVFYPLALLGLAGIVLVALHLVNPSLLRYMLRLFAIFSPAGASLTIGEMQPILMPAGRFSLEIVWVNFTTSFFMSLISLAILVYPVIKERNAERTLFLIWSIILLIAMLGQRRFGYYYTVNAALLTGFLSWKIMEMAGISKLRSEPGEAALAVKESGKRRNRPRDRARAEKVRQRRGTRARAIVVMMLVFFLVFFWILVPTKYDTVSKTWSAGPPTTRTERPVSGFALVFPSGKVIMDEAWYTSLVWLRANSPEPFGDPGAYYELYPSRVDFEYPATAYGVMSWWDYGYYIMQISRRIPNCNPGQAGAVQAARYFTARDQSAANQIADRLGSKYVIVDFTMPIGKMHAFAEWADVDLRDFYETYYQPTQDGRLSPVVLYHPAYYRSMIVRLYNFDGQAVLPNESVVISYAEEPGTNHRVITGIWPFPTYAEAEEYIAGQETDNYRIVSDDPFRSPVPLEELSRYELVHASAATVRSETRSIPQVKIFEYLGPNGP